MEFLRIKGVRYLGRDCLLLVFFLNDILALLGSGFGFWTEWYRFADWNEVCLKLLFSAGSLAFVLFANFYIQLPKQHPIKPANSYKRNRRYKLS